MKTLLLILFTTILSCCSDGISELSACDPPNYQQDGLKVGHLSEEGIDSENILKATERIRKNKYGEIHSMLIYRNNKLVFEEYFSGHKFKWDAPGHYGSYTNWNASLLHHIHSVTKSITSLCIGIAIDKGFIKDVHETIFEYLPDHQHLKKDGKQEITIEHLLTMTSGLEWLEWGIPYNTPRNPIIGIWYSDKDPVSFILEGELRHGSGTYYAYYGGNQILLGEILKNATNMSIDTFSQQYLFEPLEIESAQWASKFDNGVIEAAGGVIMKPRDMIKIGAMILNKGTWNENKVLSEEWIYTSSSPYSDYTGITIPGEDWGKVGYAYGWWTKNLSYERKNTEIFFALGWGGQKIILIPEYDLAVVFTGANYYSKVKHFEILRKYILPAIM